MKKNKLIIVSVIVILIIASIIIIKSQSNPEQTEGELKFKLVKNYQNSILSEQQSVIRSQEEWSALLNEMSEAQQPGEIDFDEKMLLAVFYGQKPNGGYSIEITDVIETPSSLEIYVKQSQPGQGCMSTQAFTYPYQIVEIRKSDKPVVNFNIEQETRQCQNP